ncbi:hypothetical protein [Herbaspirillum robiniae]|uniref:hypothetical protein n=1 Tax=Herbaspirillum robiniae TaxID=2014887 RepID=UPI003D783FF3
MLLNVAIAALWVKNSLEDETAHTSMPFMRKIFYINLIYFKATSRMLPISQGFDSRSLASRAGAAFRAPCNA